MSGESPGIVLAEFGLVPLPALRLGIRRLLAARLREGDGDTEAFAERLRSDPVAIATDQANEQHYEVPPEFFERVLGPAMKYSGAYWDTTTRDLAEAELRMLELTCARAGVKNGQRILELGCGWGSLSLHLARRYPECRITAVSNSVPQRRFIEARAPANLQVLTADMNDLRLEERFDRVLSVEMFEHMRNWGELLRRIRGWMHPDGRLFVHVFCHRDLAYPFETDGADNWMGRHFFTGGIMPSLDLISRFDRDLRVEDTWEVGGSHYARTARAWRENLEAERERVLPVLDRAYGGDARRWYHRWRIFFLACEELFGYREGSEWMVGHYRMVPAHR